MGRRFTSSNKQQQPKVVDQQMPGPKTLPLSPKNNWVSNAQALKGVGATKVGESFDEEAHDAIMKPVKHVADDESIEARKNAILVDASKKAAAAKKSKKQLKAMPASPNKPEISIQTTAEGAIADENNNTATKKSPQNRTSSSPKNHHTANQPKTMKSISQINAAAVLSVFASTSPRSQSSPKHQADADGSKSPQSKRGEKRSGNFKWFRKGRKDKDQHHLDPHSQHTKSPRTPRNFFGHVRSPTSPSEVTKEDTPEPPPAFTSPLRLQLWLGAVKQSIVKVIPEPETPKVVEELGLIHEEPEMMMHPPVRNPSSFYRHTVDTGVYVDYSTFDDGESVSSIDLLFKWLTCRDVTAEANKPTSIHTSNTQVESDVSFDADAQPRRRVLFSP